MEAQKIKTTYDGTLAASLKVATKRRWRAQDGTTQEKTVWFSISAWRRMGRGLLIPISG